MKIENFIASFDNLVSKEDCKLLIDHFEYLHNINLSHPFRSYSNAPAHMGRQDESIFLNQPEVYSLHYGDNIIDNLRDKIWQAYLEYVEHFSIIQSNATHGIITLRLQKTPIGGGFHTWHCEHYDSSTSKRILVFQLYLNDVDEGGETEFLYQNKRIYAKEGTGLIWPAGFTHPHRGNPPISNDKYIITGWFEYFE